MATVKCATCQGKGKVERPDYGWITCGNCKGRKIVER